MFKKAQKNNLFAKILIEGITGSGKTPGALLIAEGMRLDGAGSIIGMIDTEEGKGALYSPSTGEPASVKDLRFDFLHYSLQNHAVEAYILAIDAAQEMNIDILIIDSLSHEWNDLLVRREEVAQESFQGNSWAASSVTVPLHKHFIQKILRYPGHVICTTRSKINWVTIEGKPIKVGNAPVQREDIEYEFDIVIELDKFHSATILRWRNNEKSGIQIGTISTDLGKDVATWCDIKDEGWIDEMKQAVTIADLRTIFTKYPQLKQDAAFLAAGTEAKERINSK